MLKKNKQKKNKKKTTTTKAALIFKNTQDIPGSIFCGGRDFNKKSSESSIFINSIDLNCIQYIFISRGTVFFLFARNI